MPPATEYKEIAYTASNLFCSKVLNADVNGDGLGDLVLGSNLADNTSSNSGAAWVMFSTLIDNAGTSTGNNNPLSTAAKYNIRYDGGAALKR